jgi:hypothetical protein
MTECPAPMIKRRIGMLFSSLKKDTAAKKPKMDTIRPAFKKISLTTIYSILISAAFQPLPMTSYVNEIYGTSRRGYAIAIVAAYISSF